MTKGIRFAFFGSLLVVLSQVNGYSQAFRGLGFLNPSNPQANSQAYGISGNGLVVVGGSYGEAFRWTAAGGMQSLGIAGASTAYAASLDGSVIVVLTGPVWRKTLARFPRTMRPRGAKHGQSPVTAL